VIPALPHSSRKNSVNRGNSRSRTGQPHGCQAMELLEEHKLSRRACVGLIVPMERVASGRCLHVGTSGSPSLSRGSAHTPHPSASGRGQPSTEILFHQRNACESTGARSLPQKQPELLHGGWGISSLPRLPPCIRSTAGAPQEISALFSIISSLLKVVCIAQHHSSRHLLDRERRIPLLITSPPESADIEPHYIDDGVLQKLSGLHVDHSGLHGLTVVW